MYEYHHWGAHKKITDIFNKRDKNPEALRLVEQRQKITVPGKRRINIDSKLNRMVLVPRRKHKKRRDKVASIDEALPNRKK